MDSLRDEILKLPDPEKVKIAKALYESIVNDPYYEFELTTEQKTEIDRRLENCRNYPNDHS